MRCSDSILPAIESLTVVLVILSSHDTITEGSDCITVKIAAACTLTSMVGERDGFFYCASKYSRPKGCNGKFCVVLGLFSGLNAATFQPCIFIFLFWPVSSSGGSSLMWIQELMYERLPLFGHSNSKRATVCWRAGQLWERPVADVCPFCEGIVSQK